MSKKDKCILLLMAALFAAAFVCLSLARTRVPVAVENAPAQGVEPPGAGTAGTTAGQPAEASACPDFRAPAEPTMGRGWHVYARPDLCVSLEYPDGWGIKEIRNAFEVEREENLSITTFTTETSFAFIGVNEINPSALSSATHVKYATDLKVGTDDCWDFNFAGRPLTECVRLTPNGRVFVISYGLNPDRTDEAVIKQIKSTVVVW